MPIHKTKSGKWKWGKSGKEYDNKEDAERQMRAIFASGYKEDATPMSFREFVKACRKVEEADRDGEYEQSYHNKEKPNMELLFGKKAVSTPSTKNDQAKKRAIAYRKKKLQGYLELWQRKKYEQEIKDLEG